MSSIHNGYCACACLQVSVVLKMTVISILIRLIILPAIFIPLTLALSSAGFLTKDPVVIFVLCLESSVSTIAATIAPCAPPHSVPLPSRRFHDCTLTSASVI